MTEGDGKIFGRYRLIRLIGEGGMARVHLARQLGPEGFVKPCVLKRMAPELQDSARYRRMFLQEARVSALLNHPNIVQTFDFGEEESQPYMAMELVDGMNLSVLCRGLAAMNRWVPLRASVEACAQVCEALHYAHELQDLEGRSLNLVHRDVSPQNILVSRQGIVKLADFGIARHDDRIEVTIGPQSRGKPGYIAPEQISGGSIDGRADLFAVGIVLTELVSARRVSAVDGLTSILEVPGRVRQLCDLRSEASPSLRALAVELTTIDLEGRPKNAKEVASRLRSEAAALRARDDLTHFLSRVFRHHFPSEVQPTTAAAGGPELQPDLAAMSTPSAWNPRDDATAEDDRHAVPFQTVAEEVQQLPPPPRAPSELPRPPGTAEQSVELADMWSALNAAAEPQPAALYAFWPDSPASPSGESDQTARRPEPSGANGSGEGQRAPAPDSVSPERRAQIRRATSGVSRPPRIQIAAAEAPRKIDGLADGAASVLSNERFVRWLVAVVIVGVLAAVATSMWWYYRPPPKLTAGSLGVTSQPPGAQIFFGAQDTGEATPHDFHMLSPEVPLTVRVRMPGFVSDPSERLIRASAEPGRATVHFALTPARTYRLETTPTGAHVVVAGRKLQRRTPLDLPPIRMGDSATVTVRLEGYLDAKLVVTGAAGTASVTTLALESAQTVDIVTYPPGGTITVDDRQVGVAPQWGVSLPAGRSFTIRAERVGHVPWAKRYAAGAKSLRRIEIELKELPLLEMPLSPEQRDVARKLLSRLNEARRHLNAARRRLERAKSRLEALSKADESVAAIVETKEALSEARADIEGLEVKEEQLRGEVDALREAVRAKELRR